MRSESIEDYLKAIYKLQSSEDSSTKVTTSLICKRMNVSPASATNMVKKLADINLVYHAPYHGVELTEAGQKIALEIIRHHRLIELYLSQALGYPWDEIDAEAERLEHAISEDFEDRIDRALGYPTIGAHGEPIPNKKGEIVQRHFPRLAELASGINATIRRVSDHNPEMLRYINQLDLSLGTLVKINGRAPFNGPISLLVDKAKQCSISIEVAEYIFAEPITPSLHANIG
ncbi:MAG: metal-dependent transcriptional regulator [Candidatus Latescibacterota bacterium]|nr:metal-dependent transcriptional regulator [Candidatus Latescibacterota bacterium]